MSSWQPIETAPKDGTWVLLNGGAVDAEFSEADAKPNPAVVGFWYATEYWPGCWVYAYWDGAWYSAYENPTHWMPIPAPPITEPVDAWANGYT